VNQTRPAAAIRLVFDKTSGGHRIQRERMVFDLNAAAIRYKERENKRLETKQRRE
jgi:hypothetical protein